jgi:hypothetical protein
LAQLGFWANFKVGFVLASLVFNLYIWHTKSPTDAKPRDVTSNAMTTVQHQTDRQKMNRKPNASAKSKEVQRHPQANTQLHHICFCPTALRAMTTFRF